VVSVMSNVMQQMSALGRKQPVRAVLVLPALYDCFQG
jgi:hypothetical protein